MSTVVGTTIFGTISNGSGMSNGSHLIYAENAARWIVFNTDNTTTTKIQAYISSSNDLSTATWSALTSSPVFTNARAHGNDGRNFGVGYANIASTDVIHIGIGITGGFDQTIRATVVTNNLTWGSWAELNSAATFSAPTADTIGFSNETSPHISESSVMLHTNRDAEVRASTNADAGTSWTAGYNTVVTTDSTTVNVTHSYFICPVDTTGKMAIIFDHGDATTSLSNLRSNVMTVANTWPTTGSIAAVTVTTIDFDDWAACRISNTSIWVFARSSSATNAWKISLYNGNATWTAKTAPATQTQKAASGVHLATDGTDLWAFIIDSDAPNTVRYNKYTVGSDTWGGWTALETSTKTRNFISGYKTAKNSQINVVWTETNGSNFDAVVSSLSLAAAPSVTTDMWHPGIVQPYPDQWGVVGY